MDRDLTKGPVVRSMLLFAIPMILGDLLQQCYNIADTLIVGQFLGRDAYFTSGPCRGLEGNAGIFACDFHGDSCRFPI